jgi:Flp pilus assembly protein TadG
MDTNGQIASLGSKKGFVLIWFVMLIPVVLLFTAIAVDFTYMYVVKGQLQNAADSAALAGAAKLIRDDNAVPTPADITAARDAAVAFALTNKAAGQNVVINKDTDITFGYWDVHYTTPSVTYVNTTQVINAIQVRAARDTASASGQVPILFGKYFGWDKMGAAAVATAAIPVRSTGPITMCFKFCQPGTAYPSMVNYTSLSDSSLKPIVVDTTQSGTPKCSDSVVDVNGCLNKFAWTSYASNVSSSSDLQSLVCNQNLISLPTCGTSIYATMGNDVPPLRSLEAQMYNPYFDSGNKDRVVRGGLDTTGWWLIVPITKICPPGKQGGASDPREVSGYAKVHILYIYSSGGGNVKAPCLDYSAPASLRNTIQNKYGISIANNSIVIDKISCADCASGSFFPGRRPVLVTE